MIDKNLKNPKEERRSWVWIMFIVNMVFILLLMLLGIIALRVGNYLPEGTDILFIVGKNPSVEIGDSEHHSWESVKNVNIFQADYQNEEGTTTIISQDGTKVVAPGMETSYIFTMYNNGNMAVVYETDIDFNLKIGGIDQQEYTFPLAVRLLTESGDYLIGSSDEWINVNDAKISKHVSVLGANSYENFTLQLQWKFDSGNDELDTMLGDQSVEEGVALTLGINTYAEEHLDPTAKGGISISGQSSQEYGGTIRWLWLVLLFINTSVLIFYIGWLLNKKIKRW